MCVCASECDSCLLLLVAVCLFDFCFCLVYARFFIAASICVHFAVQLVVVVVVVRVLAISLCLLFFASLSSLSVISGV